jgi:hypothetical protein
VGKKSKQTRLHIKLYTTLSNILISLIIVNKFRDQQQKIKNQKYQQKKKKP